MELTPQIVAFYIGQPYQVFNFNGEPFSDPTPIGCREIVAFREDGFRGQFKPILRRLESLTEAEARELYEVQNDGWYWSDEGSAVEHFFGGFDLDEGELLCGSKVWLKLLSWGFDLFGLIDSGVAIDAATLEKTVEIWHTIAK